MPPPDLVALLIEQRHTDVSIEVLRPEAREFSVGVARLVLGVLEHGAPTGALERAAITVLETAAGESTRRHATTVTHHACGSSVPTTCASVVENGLVSRLCRDCYGSRR